MIKITFVDPNGVEHPIEAEAGQSLMQVGRSVQVPGIEASCGGNCICATCHRYLDQKLFEQLTPPDEIEAAMLECLNDPQATSRLTCQVPVSEALDGVCIQVAASQH